MERVVGEVGYEGLVEEDGEEDDGTFVFCELFGGVC